MKVDGFVLENPTDLFYFTGLQFSRGRLLITKTKTVLFVDGRYKEAAQKGSSFSVKPLEKKALEESLIASSGKVFGFDHGLSVGAYKELKRVFAKKKKTLKGCDHPTLNVRVIKEKQELEKIKKSAALLWKGFLYIKKQLKVGVSEIELARKFEFYVKNHGAEALSFEPIVAFGSNSALPHHHSSERKLKKGELVLIDIGVVVEGYASDMTRTLFFGKVSKRLEALYKTVIASQEAALEQCKAGVHVSELDKAARKAMGKDVKHFLHSLGHGIGLDVHEYPSISLKEKKAILESGMVVTIEPGLYLSGVGGIRHEDMVIITKTGHINLFK